MFAPTLSKDMVKIFVKLPKHDNGKKPWLEGVTKIKKSRQNLKMHKFQCILMFHLKFTYLHVWELECVSDVQMWMNRCVRKLQEKPYSKTFMEPLQYFLWFFFLVLRGLSQKQIGKFKQAFASFWSLKVLVSRAKFGLWRFLF